MDQLFVEPEQNLQSIPKIQETTIADSVVGNVDTINMMKRIARIRSSNPLVRKLALNILQQAQVPSHHFLDEALAIGDFVKNKVRYVRDPDNVEYLQDPLDMVKAMQEGSAQGDCDDMALLTATLLLSTGHQPYFRAVRYENAFGNYNHIYVVVFDKNPGQKDSRIVLDCILKDQPIGSEVNHINGDDFAIP